MEPKADPWSSSSALRKAASKHNTADASPGSVDTNIDLQVTMEQLTNLQMVMVRENSKLSLSRANSRAAAAIGNENTTLARERSVFSVGPALTRQSSMIDKSNAANGLDVSSSYYPI